MFFDDETLAIKRQSRLKTLPPIHGDWRPPTEFPNLSAAKIIGFDVETYEPEFDKGPGWSRGKGYIVGFSISAEDNLGNTGAWYFPVRHTVEPEYNLDPVNTFKWAKYILETPSIPKVGANLIYDIGWATEESIFVEGQLHDVQFAEALLNEDGEVNLDYLGFKYLDEGKTGNQLYEWCALAYGGDAGPKQRENIWRAPPRLVGKYGEQDADMPLRIIKRQWPLMEAEGLLDIYRMECDLIPLLIRMRRQGVRVDVNAAERLYGELRVDIERLYGELGHISGVKIDTVGSPQQLAKVFDAAGISYPKTEKGNPSFRKEWLAAQHNPIADLIKDIREHDKIRSTFIRSYILESNVNGIIHGQFHPLRGDTEGTRSGRLACVAGWTEVQTSLGLKRIDAIQVGDAVLTHKNRFMPVVATWLKGREQMLKVTFSNGNILTCTTSHRVLTTEGVWVSIGELYEHFKILGKNPMEYQFSRSVVSKERFTNFRTNCRAIKYDVTQRFLYYKKQYSDRGTKGFSCASIFEIERSRKKSNVREDWRSAPQLDWVMRRWLWLFNCFAQRRASICASCCNGASAWFAKITRWFRRASYRQQSEKQRFKQLSSGDTRWSQKYSFPSSEGFKSVTIVKIDVSGCHAVYDITVLDDESYGACGVFSHNSSKPNLQNIPSRTLLGKRVRKLFIPFAGHFAYGKRDYSQIEYRFLSHYAVGPGSDELRATYINDPKTDYHKKVQGDVKRITGKLIERKPIKSLNFGLVYAQGKDLLCEVNGFTPEEGEQVFTAYHTGAPYVKATLKATADEAAMLGYITTILGRRSRFNLWEPATWREKGSERLRALPYDEAIRQYGSKIKRADLHKAINRRLQGSAADQMKVAMWQAQRAGVFDVIGVPLLTVHDELGHSVIDESSIQNEGFIELDRIMENCIKLKVPVIVDAKNGPNWGSID